jgi:tetracycline resistance efflux pump
MKSISNIAGVALLLLAIICYFTGSYALVPAFTVLGVAIITRKALEPLIIGCAVGFLMLPAHGIPALSDELFPAFKDLELASAREGQFPLNMLQGLEDTIGRYAHDGGLIWIILVCILYGAFVQLLVASGGIGAIADYSTKFVKTKKGSLKMTYFLSFFFFIDDYLNALAVGNIMRPITDKFKVSRDKLAMVMSFVCVPWTVIFPISTWTIFYGTQLMTVESIAASNTNAVSAFLNTIPYNFSAIVSIIIGGFLVFGLLPDSKAIKAAELAAENQAGEEVVVDKAGAEKSGRLKLWYFSEEEAKEKIVQKQHGSLYYFTIPLGLLILFTIMPYPTEWNAEYFTIDGITGNIDALRGIATAVVMTYIGFLVFGVMKFEDISENFVKGLETITFVLVVLGFTYLLKDVQGALGFDGFVESNLSNNALLNSVTLPAIVFVVIGLICWATGSNWGIYAILVPTTAVLSNAIGADFWLTQGALVSGTVWGAAACFFSDNRVLTAQSCNIDMMKHGMSQFAYQLIIFGVSTALYLVAAVVL